MKRSYLVTVEVSDSSLAKWGPTRPVDLGASLSTEDFAWEIDKEEVEHLIDAAFRKGLSLMLGELADFNTDYIVTPLVGDVGITFDTEEPAEEPAEV